MTSEQQRIAIAEACGWKNFNSASHEGAIQYGQPPNALHNSWELPDYLNDLNAMHEAEQVLIEEQAEFFEDELCDIAKSANDLLENPTPWKFSVCHATAAQRAKAFLLTLGLWQETPPQLQ